MIVAQNIDTYNTNPHNAALVSVRGRPILGPTPPKENPFPRNSTNKFRYRADGARPSEWRDLSPPGPSSVPETPSAGAQSMTYLPLVDLANDTGGQGLIRSAVRHDRLSPRNGARMPKGVEPRRATNAFAHLQPA